MNLFESLAQLDEVRREVSIGLLLELIETLCCRQGLPKRGVQLRVKALGAGCDRMVEVFGGQLAVVDRIAALLLLGAACCVLLIADGAGLQIALVTDAALGQRRFAHGEHDLPCSRLHRERAQLKVSAFLDHRIESRPECLLERQQQLDAGHKNLVALHPELRFQEPAGQAQILALRGQRIARQLHDLTMVRLLLSGEDHVPFRQTLVVFPARFLDLIEDLVVVKVCARWILSCNRRKQILTQRHLETPSPARATPRFEYAATELRPRL